VYSSTLSDGFFGVGWQLGLGQISRTLRFGTPAYDDATNATDSFEFRGELLVEDAGTPGEYRTTTELFAKVVRTDPGGSDDSWTVNFPDGRKARFGTNQESRIRKEDVEDIWDPNVENHTGPVAQWLLAELEDASGNVTRYSYERSVDPGTAYPKAIEYTYRDGALVGEKRSVEFILEVRPDLIYGFAGGVETLISKRVQEIRSLAGDQVYRRLRLGYDLPADATTQRSRLTSAQVFGTDCPITETPETPTGEYCKGLPAKTFTYSDASDVVAAGDSNWINVSEPDPEGSGGWGGYGGWGGTGGGGRGGGGGGGGLGWWHRRSSDRLLAHPPSAFLG
jgi:hypothetical protein